ncbi:sensor histidine kinase [Saccharothrix longispora]|uniref:sensor histidine kinase n=1 Tax=Saccharothrix longispora TaxID=33920 RepID=UPI0028FD3945|nr:histidine kinase [Saccharothrix longispora]MBY8849046.1 sensor histidine kinase [Saccharothrix sp. MB29]MDU0291373.1 histidine kinase [Saccharothrix longispora]
MHDLLRSLWDEPRPPHPTSRARWDLVLVGALAVAAALEGALRADLAFPVVSVVVAVGLLPTLLLRRTRPLRAVVIAFGVCAATPLATGVEPELNTMVYLLLLPFALYRWGSGREAALGSLVVLAKLGSSLALGTVGLGDTLGGAVVVCTACALGAALRYRVRARTRELDQAKLLERERLARDLHDTVAHHVSAMAIRAQAGLATAAANPAAAVDALRVIESEASRALAEMRAMVRVLRQDEPVDLAPTPRVADLGQLAARPHLGPEVDVEVVGDVDDLPPSVGTAVYRLAQESVTNALRHARHATRIAVRVVADDRSVHLRVSDDGESPARPAAGRGHGLIGMAERAGLLGGTCEAGPDPDRGWTVTAVLPRTGATA